MEYYYTPKENMTLEELAAIVGWMANNAVFYGFPPPIAERHFTEKPVVIEPEPPYSKLWHSLEEFFS